MKGFDHETYVVAYLISNVAALLLLWASWKTPRLGRLLFFLLFAWASWFNLRSGIYRPEVYQGYAELTFSTWYRDFILGFFSQHTSWIVGSIAIGQGLIALSMLLKGMFLRIGTVGAIVFFLSIAPLGVGAAFPCTLIMAAGMFLLLRKKHSQFLWKHQTPKHFELA